MFHIIYIHDATIQRHLEDDGFVFESSSMSFQGVVVLATVSSGMFIRNPEVLYK